jgi:hypothetical protein
MLERYLITGRMLQPQLQEAGMGTIRHGYHQARLLCRLSLQLLVMAAVDAAI